MSLSLDLRREVIIVGNTDKHARIYPCSKCGKLRSEAEGGTTFTVCDSCWDKKDKKPDGWVAWHPLIGHQLQAAANDYESAANDLSLDHEREGWRIRPVKLVFLDEENSVSGDVEKELK